MKTKRWFVGVVLACGLTIGGGASAGGMPVIDIANLIQDVQQLVQLTTQIERLEQQIAQMQQTYQSITGNRNMGGLVGAHRKLTISAH